MTTHSIPAESHLALGSQRQSPWSIAATLVSSALTGVLVWLQFHPALGIAFAALGVLTAVKMVRNCDLPCYTIEADALVRHIGAWRRTYPWASLGTPVRIKRLHFQWFLQIGRGQRPMLLPMSGLEEPERERLKSYVEAATAALRDS